MAKLKVVVLGLALGGCQSSPSFVHVCSIVPTYTKSFEQQAGQELALLPPDAAITKMISDYLAVRAEVRDCQGN
jgi:hypothetical protein